MTTRLSFDQKRETGFTPERDTRAASIPRKESRRERLPDDGGYVRPVTDDPTTSDGVSIETLDDPESLRDGTVPVEEVDRVVPAAQFEGLREHYDNVAGVVQVGITDEDGRVLLQGSPEDGDWAPPGGPVEPGADWVAAAKRTMESQTGVDIEIRDVRLLERLRFRPADGEETVSSWGVTFGAAVEDERFLRDPEIVDHPYLPAEHEQTFAWFDAVPEDANNNHVEHVELFVE